MRCRFVVLAIMAVVPAQVPGAAQEPEPRARPPEVATTGEGTRTVQADRASVIVSVETRAPTPSAAGALNAARNTAIRDAIAALGVPREDIATSGYNVYPMRREPQYGPYDPRQAQRDTGYVANNAVRVTLRRPEQLGLVGRVIDTALTAGATLITGVHYEARRTDDAEREALADAVADARSRAEAIARAAGGSLGELLEVSTAPRGAGVEFATMARMRGAPAYAGPTPITPREIEVRQYVTARWRLVAGRR
jgi:uncharacterized protein YggE